MKLFKKITASVLACTLLMGSVSMLTSAWFTKTSSSSQVGMTTTNHYSTSRYVQATVTAYSRITGYYIQAMSNSGVVSQYGYKGTMVDRYSAHKYTGYGAIYNGAGPQTGVASSYSTNFN